MRHPWLFALTLAALFASTRVLVDAVIPPHMRWWLTATVAGITSLSTSAIWIAQCVDSSPKRKR